MNEAIEIQKETKEKLGKILIKSRYITEKNLSKALASQFGMAPISLSNVKIPIDVINLIPQNGTQAQDGPGKIY